MKELFSEDYIYSSFIQAQVNPLTPEILTNFCLKIDIFDRCLMLVAKVTSEITRQGTTIEGLSEMLKLLSPVWPVKDIFL